MVGAVVDPKLLSKERRAAVEQGLALERLRGRALEEAVQKIVLTPLTEEERALVDGAIETAVEAGNRAARKQRQVDGAARRLLFDDLFMADLGGKRDGRPEAPKRRGTVMQVAENQVRVELEDPLVEVKIEVEGVLDKEGARLKLRDRKLVIGDEIDVRATHHDGERLYFAIA